MEPFEKCQSNFNYHSGRNYQQNAMAQHDLVLNLFALIKDRMKNVIQYQDLEKSIINSHGCEEGGALSPNT